MIFDSKEFLNTDVMMASLAVIGIIGFVFERLIFQTLERRTVGRWGMVKAVKGEFWNMELGKRSLPQRREARQVSR